MQIKTACETVTVWPATVIVPVRAEPVFGVAAKVTLPLPVPLWPDVMVIHAALLVAVHAQPLVVVTATGPPVPPAPPIDTLVGCTENAHATAACDTVNVWPAIVSVPIRAGPVFAATLKVTLPLPVPVAPDVMVIQDALLAAVQPQPAPAVTATLLPVAPLASTA